MTTYTFDITRLHSYDDDGICVHCGHDGADHAHQNMILRAEVGDDEYKARREDTRPPRCKHQEGK